MQFLPQCSTADSAYPDEFSLTWKFKFELNDGCLVTSNGRFGVISVQRDLLELIFAKSIPGIFLFVFDATLFHVQA